MLAVCLAGLFTWVALACVERFRKSRWWWGSAVEEEDDDDEEDETGKQRGEAPCVCVPGGGHRGRQGKITEQEYPRSTMPASGASA